MVYEVILSLGLMFGVGCEDGCRILAGKDTPIGQFRATPMAYRAIGFQTADKGIFAIHPTWNEDRAARLNTIKRRNITNGCINVSEETFSRLPKRSFVLVVREEL